MTVTTEQLAAYIGADMSRDAGELGRALVLSTALVSQALANPWRAVPEAVRDECVLRTGYSIFNQGGTNNEGMFNGADGTPTIGVANDPLRKSWDLIKRYTNRV